MDEDSILITAQFIHDGGNNKVGDLDNKSFDIDFIVKKDITCEQLILSIEIGLKQLMEDNDAKKYNYRDYVRSESHPDEDRGKVFFVKKDEKPTDSQIYALCYYILLECRKTSFDVEKWGEDTKPRIGRSYINFRTVAANRIHGFSDPMQILLSKNEHGNKKLTQLGFVTASCIIFDIYGKHKSVYLFGDDDNSTDAKQPIKAFIDETPKYNISDAPIKRIDDEPVRIIPPTDPPKEPNRNLLAALISPLLMMGAMIGARILISSGADWISTAIMSGTMIAATLAVALFNHFNSKKEHSAKLHEWKEHYSVYIQNLLKAIEKRQKKDVEELKKLYPGKNNLIKKAIRMDGEIFSRNQLHPDFLMLRVGKSVKDSRLASSVFAIEGEKKDVLFTNATYKLDRTDKKGKGDPTVYIELDSKRGEDNKELPNLPNDISKRYAYLEDAPVILRLCECGTLGIVMHGVESYEDFLDNLLLEMCFYHSPDNLQCVIFGNATDEWCEQQRQIDCYKHLPHFRELLVDNSVTQKDDEEKTLSAFVFDKDAAKGVFNRLHEIITERLNAKGTDENGRFPHIVLFFLEETEYEFKHHPVSRFLPVDNAEQTMELGITFVFFKRYKEHLPEYCGKIIDVKDCKWQLLPHKRIITHQNEEKTYLFEHDELRPSEDDLDRERDLSDRYLAYKTISALYYERVAQGAGVPATVDLFDLSPKPETEDSIALNSKPQTSRTLAVPIGLRTERTEGSEEDKDFPSKVVMLDLHERADGPHMLVAGTTGSGKSETILTYLIELCKNFSPRQVNLLLVDMKGGGFIKRLKKENTPLPHIVGSVTDVEGDENGTGSSYMLGRFLRSMDAEVKRRKLLFNRLGVDNINDYIRAFDMNDIPKYIKDLRLDENVPEQKEKIASIKAILSESNNQLPHLFVVIDEFTELMQFSGDKDGVDFKSRINSLFRVGRSLGFHLILVSQNIEGSISDEIRVNARARLCLKVATRSASKEMIGTDIAASPQMPGNGRAYLLVGTGSRFEYFQSGYSGASSATSKKDERRIIVTQAKMSGLYRKFYDSHSNEPDDPNTQLMATVKKIINERKEKSPKTIFLPPLPTHSFYDFKEKAYKEVVRQNDKKEDVSA